MTVKEVIRMVLASGPRNLSDLVTEVEKVLEDQRRPALRQTILRAIEDLLWSGDVKMNPQDEYWLDDGVFVSGFERLRKRYL